MLQPNFVILYVESPLESVAFYSDLLGLQAVEASPTFALFILESGAKFGLWAKHTVEPAASMTGGGVELALAVADKETVLGLHSKWRDRRLPIAQEPVEMDFGYTFVALDPDGHRLRVFVPSAD